MTAMEIMTGTEDATIAKRERRRILVRSALIIFVVAILATTPGWLPGRIYGSPNKIAVGSRLAVDYAAQRLKEGEIPLWNPNVGLGAPVIGDGQTGIFYPTILLHMMLPAKWAWVADGVLKFWLAGFGVVMLVMGFAPRIGSHSESYGAVFAAILFMLALMCLALFDAAAVNAVALLPWAVIATGALLKRLTAARLVGMTLLLLVIFLAGENAAAVGIVLACVVYLFWNFARGPKEWERLSGAILALAAAVSVAATVAAVQWMPAYYNEGIEGINGFATARRSIVNPMVLVPGAMLGLAMLFWWSGGHRNWRGRFALSWMGGLAAVGWGIILSTGPKSRPDLVEASKWVRSQGETAGTMRFIAEEDKSSDVQDNILAQGPSGPRRMGKWLKSVEQIQPDQMRLAVIDHPALRLLGAKYLITDRRMEPTTRPATASATAPAPTRRLFGRQPLATPMGKMEWKPVWPTTRPSGGVVVYENVAQPLPRFWIARNAQWSDKAQQVLDRLRNMSEQADFDPHDVVLLDREGEAESEFGMLRRPPPVVGRANLQLLEDSPERVRIATEGAGGWLVLADAYAPGWRAKMSYTAASRGPRRSARERTYEQELVIVPAYGALRAVALRGWAEIVFEYEPKGWKNGLMVAGIGAIVLLLMVGGMMFPASEGSGFGVGDSGASNKIE